MSADNFSSPDRLFSSQMGDESFRLKIIGVGGAGNNAVDRIKMEHLEQVHLAVVNTDSKVLNASLIDEKLLIGRSITRGLSAGGEAEIGQEAALADRDALEKLVDGVDLVFIVAGLGGGTGSGVTPVLADIAVEKGALVIGFVTMPFTKEGSRRYQQAERALEELRKTCHAVVPLPNDILLQQIDENAPLIQAFALADDWIYRGVHAIWSMLFKTGLINVDFATLKKAFAKRGGKTLFGVGQAEGEDCVNRALNDLMLCPLLHTPEFSKKADNLIINIVGGADVTMTTVNEVMSVVTDKFGSRDNTVLGAVIDETLNNSFSVCVIGTTDIGKTSTYRTIFPKRKSFIPHKAVTSHIGAGLAEKGNVSGSNTNRGKSMKNISSEKKDASKYQEQDEFVFFREEEQRGYFEKTERNFYNGEDLDVPAYLRRGIRIHL